MDPTDKLTSAKLHSAGATVRHSSPFSDLEVSEIFDNPPEDMIRRWVLPFYMLDMGNLQAVREAILPVYDQIDEPLVSQLLSYFNWRPRIVGGYFAAIRRFTALTDHIGKLLLRSDVSEAAQGFCYALARFNDEESIGYLEQYLSYYLTCKDLWFDQDVVMAALIYLDQENSTARAAASEELYRKFVANKPNWNLSYTCSEFTAAMVVINQIAP